jgi:hypothetical protein
VLGLANAPETMKWTPEQFSTTTDVLVAGVPVPDVTYPRFITKPNGDLLFECRYKLSGDGDSYLREYSGTTHQWTLVGRYVQGMDANPDACAYINRIDYDVLGRLHVSWCWRDNYDGMSNHDIFYGYSEDDGRTWKNNAGVQVATTEAINPTNSRISGTCMRQGIASLQIAAIPYNRGYINQESQSSDTQGRVHILNSYIPDGSSSDSNWASSRTKSRLHHRFRKADGTWQVNQVKKNGATVNSYCRAQVVVDAFDNAFVVANGAEVYAATSTADYADWGLISDVDKNRFCSEPQVDHPRLLQEGVLSFVYLGRDGKVAVIEYLLDNPHQPAGTGLAMSIEDGLTVWNGTLETSIGEQYTLYLNADAQTQVWIDGNLLIEKTSAGQEELSALIPLIATHKHNIEIRTTSTANIATLLSWSSAHTAKATVPETALYPIAQIQDDANNLYPYSPDLPELYDFGGTDVNDLNNFIPSLNDFTLQVQATGESINIGNGYFIYTPTAAGTVRFAQKNGKIYVYEGLNYKGEFTPTVAMAFPDIYGATDNATAQTGIYNPLNLFSNPGFETVDEYIQGYDPATTPGDIRFKATDWHTLASYYGIGSRTNNIANNSGYAAMLPHVEGTSAFMLHGFGAGNEGTSFWQELTSLLPNTAYKAVFRHLSHKDTSAANSGYKARVGGFFTDYFAEYAYGSPAQGFGNYTDVSFSFVTPSTLPNEVFFFISRTAGSIAHFDRMTLVEGAINIGTGITGVSAATYLTGTAYAPAAAPPTAIVPIIPQGNVKIFSSNNNIHINNPAAQFANINVYDLTGKSVWHSSGSTNRTISTASMPAGVYVVVVSTPDKIYREKIQITN